MHEIEVKYRVHDSARLINALTSMGIRLGNPVEQDDQAYAPENWSYGDSKLGISFARLRTQSGRHLFTVKRPISNELACVEHETEVADRAAMHEAILAMGFCATVRIRKTRQVGTFRRMSLCLDRLDNIGCFFEVEMMAGPNQNDLEAQQSMDKFVRSLGADIDMERTNQTYDSLIRESMLSSV